MKLRKLLRHKFYVKTVFENRRRKNILKYFLTNYWKKILMVFVAYVFISFCWLLLSKATCSYPDKLEEIGQVAIRILGISSQTKELIDFKSWLVWLSIFPVLYYFVSRKSRNRGLPVEIRLVATIDLAIGCVATILALFCIIELHVINTRLQNPGSLAAFGLIVAVPGLIVSSIFAFLGITTWRRILALDSKSRMLNLVFLVPAWIVIALISRGSISLIYLFFGLLLVFILKKRRIAVF